jgi:ABC-2 type transport system ATP-binding protein
VRELLGEPALRIRVSGLADAPALLGAFAPVVGADDDGGILLRPLDPARVPDVVAAVVAGGGLVHAVQPGRGSLEEAFLDATRDAQEYQTQAMGAAPAPPGPPPGPPAGGWAPPTGGPS